MPPADQGTDVVLRVTVQAAESELAADLLWAHGATAVEEIDGAGGTVTLMAGMPTAEAVGVVGPLLPARFHPEMVVITDTSWKTVWRDFATPVRVGSLTVAPAWRPVPVLAGGIVLEIDPGACFGSGSHPSTRMLLAELDGRLRGGESVLDVGTGSGILAVAAARLGAVEVTATDIDPEALVVTAANAGRNGVAHRVRVAGAIPDRVFDVVLVNVTAAVQAELAAQTVAAVAAGGILLLAGLLPGQWTHVAGGFAELSLVETLDLEGWAGAVLSRR